MSNPSLARIVHLVCVEVVYVVLWATGSTHAVSLVCVGAEVGSVVLDAMCLCTRGEVYGSVNSYGDLLVLML